VNPSPTAQPARFADRPTYAVLARSLWPGAWLLDDLDPHAPPRWRRVLAATRTDRGLVVVKTGCRRTLALRGGRRVAVRGLASDPPPGARVTVVPLAEHPCAARRTHCGDPGCDACGRFMPSFDDFVAQCRRAQGITPEGCVR
jgi:hypothetical protein